MTQFSDAFNQLDWFAIYGHLEADGYAVIPGLLAADRARELARRTDFDGKTRRISLMTTELGQGDLFYFDQNLPDPWQSLHEAFYPKLAAIANTWNERLDISYRYPEELSAFLQQCSAAGQRRGQSYLSRLSAGGYVALHQRSDAEHVFPMQVVALLAAPGDDFLGGEFVMTEQRPRMQSRPLVVPLKLGDVAIITTDQRPFKGTRGDYRVNLKHAISRVRQGERIGVELTFHHSV